MSFRRRLILLVTALLSVAVLATTAVLAWNTHAALLDKARADGRLVATLLARSASLARDIPREVEAVVGDQMVAQATLAAHLVAVAEAAKQPARAINDRLKTIAAATGIAEFWITDPRGRAYLHSVPGVDFTFSPDAKAQPQAHVFHKLLQGAPPVVQETRKREIDGKVMKYVGVAGVDKARIVQVGIPAERLVEIGRRVGLERMVDALLAGGGIDAIWVLGGDLATLAHGTVLGTDRNPEPSERELAELRTAIGERETRAILTGATLTVMAPIPAEDGAVLGAALVRLPADQLLATLRTQLWLAGGVALLVLGGGVGASVALARRQADPIDRITEAAAAVETGRFNPFSLNPVIERDDELGRLARVFRAMAREVEAREEHLDTLVRIRTAALEESTAKLQSAYDRIEAELDIAREMQLAILPTRFPVRPDHQVFGTMTPAREVSGDFYDVFDLDDRTVAIVIGDVSGKGVPAAFFMLMARTAIQDLAREGLPPGRLLAAANERLCGQNPIDLFVTVFYATYDRVTGEVRYANGGHCPPLHLGPDGTMDRLRPTGGTALGVMPGLLYREDRVRLEPGGTLFLYTDGVTDALAPDGVAFGEERLVACLAVPEGSRSASAHAANVIETVSAFTAGGEPFDDLTCLVLRRLATPDPAAVPPS
ncbi:PP2C family protein-serine/threonine phosphatase [Azospirillum halopraeferens]|uniref:PP2C family protein-serine/threonine phosphatase n=1 Tax=Azospirillum halopraeferens TaxID=34010 RepID=UPI00042A75C0|nr:PP2C family protein-serine/threonine phosphatase [Azospirillum halopraeferens]